jgi:peptide chain release factor 3
VFGSERETIDEAFPGDVIGLVNATDVRVGDTLWLDRPVEFPAIPSFAPEYFAVARVKDTGRFKQFRRGIAQLDEEGVVQVLRDVDQGDSAPVLAAVGPMQFDVAVYRLENEFGAPVELSPTNYKVARPENCRA